MRQQAFWFVVAHWCPELPHRSSFFTVLRYFQGKKRQDNILQKNSLYSILLRYYGPNLTRIYGTLPFPNPHMLLRQNGCAIIWIFVRSIMFPTRNKPVFLFFSTHGRKRSKLRRNNSRPHTRSRGGEPRAALPALACFPCITTQPSAAPKCFHSTLPTALHEMWISSSVGAAYLESFQHQSPNTDLLRRDFRPHGQ
jgi:hypothetical protein